MVNSALPIDTWFHVKPEEYAAIPPDQEDAFKKKQFSMRVGYLGGYSLGLIEGLSSLDRLYESNSELFKTFYSEVSRIRPSTIPTEVLIEYLGNISKKNALSEFGTLPDVSAGSLVPKKPLPRKPLPPSNNDLISFPKSYQETLLKPQTGVDPSGTAVSITPGIDEAWSYFKRILRASGDGDSRPELDESCFDFRTLFKRIDISVNDPASPGNTKTEKVWIGNEAVDLSEWDRWFSIGSTEGKTQAIVIYALRFVRMTLEKAEAVSLPSNTNDIGGFDRTIIDGIQSKIDSILADPTSTSDADASGLRGELSKVIDAIKKYTQEVDSTPDNGDVKLGLDIDLSTAKGLINRFGDDLTNPSPIFNLFGRRLFTVLVKENNVTYTFQYAAPFISASSDRSNLTIQEQGAVGEATSLLGGGFEDLNKQPYRDSYFYKSLLVEPQEDSDTKGFLDALLPKKDSTASVTIESVKETVEVLNPAYVAGLCAAYAVSISWEGKDFFKDADERVKFKNQVTDRINKLVETQTGSLIELGGISTPLQFFNISYVMGLRSLRFFADFVVDKEAMVSGAQLVISRLRTQLPQFFTDFQDINDIRGAIAYVDRGALAVYNRLKEQDAKISELNSVVAKLTDQVQDLTLKLGEAETQVQNQNKTIRSLNSDLDKLKDEFNKLSSLSDSVRKELEKELENARKEIKELRNIVKLLKEDLELTRDRLKQAEGLIDAWTKAGQNAQGALQGVEVLAYATTGFLVGGPVGAATGAFFGKDIVDAVSQGKAAIKQNLNSAGKRIKSWFG